MNQLAEKPYPGGILFHDGVVACCHIASPVMLAAVAPCRMFKCTLSKHILPCAFITAPDDDPAAAMNRSVA